MKLIHTSDWHLGNRLMDHSRAEEFEAFLNWLLATMTQQQVDALLISGDIFDNATPSDSIQRLYCDFLSRADCTGCRHIIITAGNHDSCTQLEMAAPLLQRHHVSLHTRLKRDQPLACRLALTDPSGAECATIYAVPFLRVQDVALPTAPDAPQEERESAYTRGIAAIYAELAADAAASRSRHGGPTIAMGHLSVRGAQLTASTQNRIGTLDTVGADIFQDAFDYVALGHIHKPCAPRGASDTIRYCGSPLPMGIDEASFTHQILLVDCKAGATTIAAIPVPRFINYTACTCSTQAELEQLPALLNEQAARHAQEDGLASPSPTWLHLTYNGTDLTLAEINTHLHRIAPSAGIAHFRAQRRLQLPRSTYEEGDTLAHYTPLEIFRRKLADTSGAPPRSSSETQELEQLFSQVLTELGQSGT